MIPLEPRDSSEFESGPGASITPLSLCNSIADLERTARGHMSAEMYEYTSKTAGTGQTHRNNLAAYGHYGILPQVLKGIDEPQTRISVLGRELSTPILLSPTPWHRLYNEGGERATSLAAKAAGTNLIVSCFSSMDFEEIRGSERQDLKHIWYQMLLHKDLSVMREFIARAKSAGCGGIVLSVDAPSGCKMCSANASTSSRIIGLTPSQLPLLPAQSGTEFDTLDDYYGRCLDPSKANWRYIEALIGSTDLPVILKGILRLDDVIRAGEVGASAVIVSNHGGRQIDGAIATLEALRMIKDRRDGELKTEIYMDGGIRTGPDIFKALAFGAKAVLIGRPTLYGLATGGQQGVERVLNILQAELAQCMLLSGCSNISEVNEKLIAC